MSVKDFTPFLHDIVEQTKVSNIRHIETFKNKSLGTGNDNALKLLKTRANLETITDIMVKKEKRSFYFMSHIWRNAQLYAN